MKNQTEEKETKYGEISREDNESLDIILIFQCSVAYFNHVKISY
jgi:hypothetical protein